LITIAFSLVVYVFLGRKYFTYWAKTYIFMHALAFLIFILFPVYYTPLDATVFVQKTYQFSNFGELPSFHNLNIQIFIFIILLAKIKKEKYEKQVNILIYVALVVLLFLAVTVFIGRIVSQIHYFIDGLVSLAMCIVVCFGFMKCQYM
jgi:membrane-associated phospholipid phosphatase